MEKEIVNSDGEMELPPLFFWGGLFLFLEVNCVLSPEACVTASSVWISQVARGASNITRCFCLFN